MRQICPIVWVLVIVTCLSAPTGSLKADDDNETQPRRAVIKPSLARLKPSEQQRFKIILRPRALEPASIPQQVKWSVNAIPGGSRELGTIDANGLYHAPKKTPTPPEIHICAKVEQAENPYLFATVLMGKPVYRFVKSWTEPEGTSSCIRDPHGIAIVSDGSLIIADRDISKVSRCTIEGKLMYYVGKGQGEKPGYFMDPRVATIDPEGNIWISDCKENGPCIQAFTPKGRLIRAFAEAGPGPGQLLRAHGMDFDNKNRLFVVDVDGSRVNVYSHSGKLLYSWGKSGLKAGQFNAPHGLAVDPSGDVFVCNYYGPTQKFDANGNFLFDFAHGDPVDGPLHFHSLTTDMWGDVYIVVRRDGYGDDWPMEERAKKVKIVKYNNNGDYVTGWHFPKREDRGSCAAVDENGNVYCLFKSDDRVGVQVFAPQ